MVEMEAGSREDTSSSPSMAAAPPPILHVVVVGFHHKKGCQVEFAHPPLMPGVPKAGKSFVE
jgi:hypothetical protein